MAEGDNGVYHRARCVLFRKTHERFGGLSNMASSYPLVVNGVSIRSSEALYQACRYPHLPEVQRLIIDEKSPMAAKMQGKPYREQSRADWEQVRLRIMRWCLRVKLAQNWSAFRELLLSTGDRTIVEESRKDAFWGAIPQEEDILVGENKLGRLLIELRADLHRPAVESLLRVEPVPIPEFLLYGKPIEPVQAGRIPTQPQTDPDLSPPETALWWLPEHVTESAREQPRANTEHPAARQPSTEPVTHPMPSSATAYPRRLIEVDLPIARISAHARREKSIRHGHISTLHIWWARRPLAACRAVICAALWPDPADPLCPQKFRDEAARVIVQFARKIEGKGEKITTAGLRNSCSPESLARWETLAKLAAQLNTTDGDHLNLLRFALLDFIADFANWDNSTVPEYLETARALTQAAHEALGGEPGTRPLVVDPFAGGGSIPLEALRVGADAFASDLNPVAVLLNKVVLEYIPKYGQKLADEVRKWGGWIKEQAEKELGEFYPKDPDGATPIAYLWARTIRCEGAGCGAEVPLMRSLWLAKKGDRSVALKVVPNSETKRVDFQIIEKAKVKEVGEGTVRRGSATCPVCGYTTPVVSVRKQLKARHGGGADARLFSVVTTRPGQQGRFYRLPTERDLVAVRKAAAELDRRKKEHKGTLSLVPNEEISLNEIRRISAPIYGMMTWGDLFSPRQALALTTLCRLVGDAGNTMGDKSTNGMTEAKQTCLAAAVDRQSDFQSSLVTWTAGGEFLGHTFTRQAIPMVWDFAEGNPWIDASGNWEGAVDWVVAVIKAGLSSSASGHAEKASASAHPLPDNSVHVLATDPPYYDAVPYAYLSDFFYVWLRRSVGGIHGMLLHEEQVPKDAEIVVDRPHQLSKSNKDIAFYERELTKAFGEGRRFLRPDGIGFIVFASKTTASWEAILQAVIEAGWTITGSWPVDTEREARIAAQGQARLASSVHLVCRPRSELEPGEWRDVITALPKRIHEWMPRLIQEGVVGADAIFACLGPALEIFSRYPRVEKASGEVATLREYLEHVWAAVSTEALSTIFKDADAAGLEPDARLTAIWLWTVCGGTRAANGKSNGEADVDTQEEPEEAAEESEKAAKSAGITLAFDDAAMLSKGLGIHLERSESVVAVSGKTARLLPVAERMAYLFGKKDEDAPTGRKRGKKKSEQKMLFEDDEDDETTAAGAADTQGPPPGSTVLDRLHQAMLLFSAGRGELLKRFLVGDGVGKEARFWKLAQSLSALYPAGSDEKRWVDGVLARKKGLGL